MISPSCNNEEWRDIPGYEGLYQASTHGNIRSFYKSGVCFVLKQKKYKNAKGRVDARVSLWKDCEEKTRLVSRLVAMTWVEGYADGMTVNHIDGNPLNNHVSNLEWVTLADNIRKAFDAGLYPCKPITLVVDGEERSFRSLEAANRFLGKTHGYLSNAIKHHRLDIIDGRIIIGGGNRAS